MHGSSYMQRPDEGKICVHATRWLAINFQAVSQLYDLRLHLQVLPLPMEQLKLEA